MPTTPAPLPKIETETMRRITWRLLPFFMLCYFISYVDRVNAGFAALQMNKDLRLTQAAFGAGGALFYIAYIVFEVPSNLAMQKVGARIWIARIMITWGLVGILSAELAGRALAVGTIDGEAGRPHVTVANPDQQICAHPRFDLCGELGDEQRVVAVAASDREIVRDVRHGDRLPECHPVWYRLRRDELLGKIFGQIERPCSKHRNTPCVMVATGTLSPATAAAGIAGINTLSHIGTSGAVWLLGVIKEATGSFPMALIPLALLQIAGIVAVLWINKQETLPATSAASPVH